MKIRKMEFWIATAAFLVILYAMVQQGLRILDSPGPGSYLDAMSRSFRAKGYGYNYLINDLLPAIAYLVTGYLVFIYINNHVIPRYYRSKRYNRIAVLGLIAFLCAVLVFSVADYYQRLPDIPGMINSVMESLPRVILLFGAIFVYLEIKSGIAYFFLRRTKKNTLSEKLYKEVLIVFGIWFALLILLANFSGNGGMLMFWVTVIPYGYFLFTANLYWLIPGFDKTDRKPFTFISRELAVCLPLFTLFFLIAAGIHNESSILDVMVVLFILFTFIAIGLAWIAYQRNKEQIRQLVYFKRELGKATSNLQFLRSQINPHFLFNALNTLYGTALQEKAERTGEGIQKLGDMMRFMLHENMQERIPISREVEYIRHYVELQLLRIQSSPDILVETEIADPLNHHEITPMLLIPFVENAFKHGISLKEKSWVKIAFRCDETMLYFDSYNSIHRKNDVDPENARSGIGLENVRQRLQLLYPGRHDLIIRETAREFFVHLTLRF